jgi:hypothetical protein
MKREKLSMDDVDAILHQEMTQRLGYDAKDHMMREPRLTADLTSFSIVDPAGT